MNKFSKIERERELGIEKEKGIEEQQTKQKMVQTKRAKTGASATARALRRTAWTRQYTDLRQKRNG